MSRQSVFEGYKGARIKAKHVISVAVPCVIVLHSRCLRDRDYGVQCLDLEGLWNASSQEWYPYWIDAATAGNGSANVMRA